MSREVWNLLEEFDKLENDIRKSMVIYEREIINGINFVREIVKEINSESIDNEFKENVLLTIKNYQQEMLSKMKIVDNYMQYGINCCLRIIDGFIRIKNKDVKKLRKERYNFN